MFASSQRGSARGLLLAFTSIAGLAGPAVALAQSAEPAQPAAAQPAASEPVTLGEMVITARKQSEKLQDVPLNITAMSSETLTALGVKNFFDLMQFTPSLSFGNTGQRTGNKLTTRGLGISTTGASKTSVFLDGVYISGDYTGLSLAGLQRVEVLKGPQSALFGRSSFAGAINLVTRDPKDYVEGAASFDVANFGEVHADGYVSGPLVADKLYGYLSASYYDFAAPDAWKDASDGSRHGSQASRGVMGKLTYKFNEDVTLKGLFSYSKNDDGPSSALFIDPASRNGAIAKINPLTGVATGAYAYYPTGSVPSFKPSKGDYNYFQGYLDNPGDRIEQWRSYLQLDWNLLDGHSLTVTGAHNDQITNSQSNIYLRGRPLASIGGYVFNSISRIETYDDSLEVRLASPQEQRFRYALGVYYLDIQQHNKPSTSYYVSSTAAADLVSAGSYSLAGNKDYSAFGAVYYDILPQLTVSLEARYQAEKVKRTGANAGAITVTAYQAGARGAMTALLAPDGSEFEKTFKAFLPRFNVQYKFSPDLNVYVTYSKGNNPGGFNTSAYATTDQRYIQEENLYNYEAGLKAKLGRSLSFDMAVYHMDWKNQQTTGTFYNSAGIIYSIVNNVGSSKIDGAEAELAWQTPVPGLDLRSTLSYNKGKYKNFCSANYAAMTYTIPTTATSAQKVQYSCRAVDGNALESVPTWQGSLDVSYTHALKGDWEGFIGGSYAYTGSMWDSELNLAKVSAANVFNARAGLENGRYTVEIYGKNLTDEDAPTRITRASDAYAGATNSVNQSLAFTPRTPRQYGFRMSMSF